MTDDRPGLSQIARPCQILVASGGTSAPIDEVRKITNISTGRFGSKIAEAALERGTHVLYLHAPNALTPFAQEARLDLNATNPEREIERLRSVQQRWRQVSDRLELVPLYEGTVPEYAETLQLLLRNRPIDIVIMTMAVSDYAPIRQAGKLSSNPDEMNIRCVRQPKVIRSVRDWSPDVFLVGFKLLAGADDAELFRQAEAAGLLNRADLTVANDMRTVREGRHVVHLIRQGHEVQSIGPGPDVAAQLVDRILDLWTDRQSLLECVCPDRVSAQ